MRPEQELQDALAETVSYLGSEAAIESIRADPYWPKWNAPWWRMTLLWELGRADLVPRVAVEAMVEGLRTHYLPDFPARLDELPPEIDSRRQVICHCAVGTMFQVLHACGVDVDERLAWMRPWMHRYQLPDGGLNCDEKAYAKTDGKSSLLSTLPPLEALLRCSPRPWPDETARFLERGARYLVRHRLVRRASGDGSIIDPEWLETTFPRFYDYDALRGLSFLTEWAQASASRLPPAAIDESLEHVERNATQDGGVAVRREPEWATAKTMDRVAGAWELLPRAHSFALLEVVDRVGRVSPELTAELETVRRRVDDLRRRALLAD